MDRNCISRYLVGVYPVALRKESVDRNDIRIAPIDSIIDVALRKESVDRNYTVQIVIVVVHGRSPQGERG